jgi:TRAP-type C4-dicarboxylate transport system substrate-binding protein
VKAARVAQVARIAIAAVLSACLSACAPPSPAPTATVTTLTYASPYAPGHPFSRADQEWIAWVSKRSNGSIRVQPYWSGGVLSSEHSMTELRHGVVDIGLITPIYVRGGTHLIRAQAAYYGGLKTFGEQVALYHCMQLRDPQFARELEGLHVLAVQGGNLPGILTTDQPVETLADLRGLRLRAPAELLPVLRHLGADPVEMPMGAVYSALAKGVLDGVVAPRDTLKSLHFAEVAHHFATFNIPRGAYAARAMGEKRWLSLSDEQRAILDEGIAVWERALESQLLAAELAGDKEGHANGVTFSTPSSADLDVFLKTYDLYAERSAQALRRFEIDGLPTYRHARALVDRAAQQGKIDCNGDGA